jgi:hypothetical protein
MCGRRFVVVLTCMAVIAVLVGVTACGSSTSSTSTTTIPSSTTVSTAASATSSAASVSTSEAGTVPSSTSSSIAVTSTASSVALTPELQKYEDEMNAIGDALDTAPDTGFLSITDPTAATAADIQQADAVSALLHKLQDQLLAIKPPAQLADLHNKFVSAFAAELKTMDDWISALKNKDAATMKAASETILKTGTELQQSASQLAAAAGGDLNPFLGPQ